MMSQIQEECSVYVGNLDVKVPLADTEELVYELFLQAGPIEKIYLPSNHATGLHKTYGFVQYEHKASVVYAISLLSGLCLSGRPLKVRASAKSEQTPATACPDTTQEVAAPSSVCMPPVADDATIEAKLREQFGSRLSRPPLSVSPIVESAASEMQQRDNDTPPPIMSSSGTISSSAGYEFRTPSSLPPHNASIPSLPPITPHLPLPPLPDVYPPGLPHPPPGIPLPFFGLPLPPPGLDPPLPPAISSLFPPPSSLVSGHHNLPATFDAPIPPHCSYGYQQLPPPVSVPPYSLLEELAGRVITTASVSCSGKEHHILGKPEGDLQFGQSPFKCYQNGDTAADLRMCSSPLFSENGSHYSEVGSRFSEDDLKVRNDQSFLEYDSNLAESIGDNSHDCPTHSLYATDQDAAYAKYDGNSAYRHGQEDSNFELRNSYTGQSNQNSKKRRKARNRGRYKNNNGMRLSEVKSDYTEDSPSFPDLSHKRLHREHVLHVDDKPSWMSQDTSKGIQEYHLKQLKDTLEMWKTTFSQK